MSIYDRDWYREEYKKKEHLLEQGHTPQNTAAASASPVPPRTKVPPTTHSLTRIKITAIAVGAGVLSYLVVSVILDYL
ncbi:hypothetical protein [Burkholderia pseudomallei]|uniref:hypothetical protein n=1 Tax=Burkholderia pseudomallei TaxID=28450 RepID=UPI000532094C|nr:hypothetical protein [Burkholderia pseudomallei]KGS35506.1 hypothetical protein X992_6080 [Burkholderia pseudomallei MSHR5492]KGW11415.1 hypothetical protein X980_1855 [Burkholderia pseudomallei MSHR4000]KGX36695.1 hypothetical protein Y598_115 [Burkholderia pseudomallei MSHR3335]ONA10586.1 hypothetical protein AQ876_06705 [Burkholderia pseudomallei]ONC21765.1 hypothetical protein AQ913_15045 [Burkholderia pseudomallei]